MKKREIDITAADRDKMLTEARKTSLEHYLILALPFKAGLRRSEVVGEDDPRDGHWPTATFLDVQKAKVKAKRQSILDAVRSQGYCEEYRKGFEKPWVWVEERGMIVNYNDPANMLTGLRVEDFDWKQRGVWLRGKKQDRERFHPIPESVLGEIREYIGSRAKGRLFQVSTGFVWQLFRRYARAAGVQDWDKIHPHRGRSSYITEVWKKTENQVLTQRLARHKNWATTEGAYIAKSTPEELTKGVREVFA